LKAASIAGRVKALPHRISAWQRPALTWRRPAVFHSA